MLSGHVEEVYVRESTEAGACGYVMKKSPGTGAVARRQVLGDEVYFSEQVRGIW